MGAVVLWAAAAWWWGIPTSESHALAAGLSGAAVALEGALPASAGRGGGAVLLGLVPVCGRRALGGAADGADDPALVPVPKLFRLCQIPGAAGTAFFTGPRMDKSSSASSCWGGPGPGTAGGPGPLCPTMADGAVRRRHGGGDRPGRAADHRHGGPGRWSPWAPGGFAADLAGVPVPAGGHPAGPSGVHHPHQDGGAAGVGAAGPRGADWRVVRSIPGGLAGHLPGVHGPGLWPGEGRAGPLGLRGAAGRRFSGDVDFP